MGLLIVGVAGGFEELGEWVGPSLEPRSLWGAVRPAPPAPLPTPRDGRSRGCSLVRSFGWIGGKLENGDAFVFLRTTFGGSGGIALEARQGGELGRGWKKGPEVRSPETTDATDATEAAT